MPRFRVRVPGVVRKLPKCRYFLITHCALPSEHFTAKQFTAKHFKFFGRKVTISKSCLSKIDIISPCGPEHVWMCFNEKSCLWCTKKLITQKPPRIQPSTLWIKNFLRFSAFQRYRGQGVWLLGKLAKEAPKNEGWFVEIATFGTWFVIYFFNSKWKK